MGIKDVNQVIGKYAKQGPLKKHQGETIGIDVSNWMHKFLKSPGYSYHEKPILKGFLNQIIAFNKNGVTPFYVFDGEASDEKADTIQKRKEANSANQAKLNIYQEELNRRNNLATTSGLVGTDVDGGIGADVDISICADVDGRIDADIDGGIDDDEINLDDKEELNLNGDDEDELDEIKAMVEELINGNKVQNMSDDDLKKKIESMKMNSRLPTHKDVKLCKKLFNFMGVKYIHAVGEADETLASLERCLIIDAVLSADMDLLTYGVSCLLTDVKSSKQGHVCKEYNLNDILIDFNWTQEKFVDFCILSGCDYVDRIPKLGVKNAKKFIDTHFTIDNVVASLNRKKKSAMKVPDGYMDKVIKARRIFNLERLYTHLFSQDGSVGEQVITDGSGGAQVITDGSGGGAAIGDGSGGAQGGITDGELVFDKEAINQIWMNLIQENTTKFTMEEKKHFFTKYNLPFSDEIVKKVIKEEPKRKMPQKGQKQITNFFK